MWALLPSPDFSSQSRSAGMESDPEVPFVRMRAAIYFAHAHLRSWICGRGRGVGPPKVAREIGGRFVESSDHQNVYFSLFVVMFVST